MRGYKESVLELLKVGALIITQNKDGDTSLILASKHGYLNIVESILSNGEASEFINIKGFGGSTAFLSAAKGFLQAGEIEKEVNYLSVLKLLVAHDADVNISDAANLSAIDWASKEGKIKLISVLLDLKCYLTKQNKARINICLFALPIDEEIQRLFKKIKIIENSAFKIAVKLHLMNKPYALIFKIDSKKYRTEGDNDAVNIKFNKKINKLDNVIFSQSFRFSAWFNHRKSLIRFK